MENLHWKNNVLLFGKTDDFRLPLRGCWSRLYYQSNVHFVLFYFLCFPYTQCKIFLQN